MAKIAIDCDGVLAIFIKGFFETANTIWPGRLDINYQNKSWDDVQGLNVKEVEQVWAKIQATQDWWLTLNAYTENVGALAIFLHTHTKQDIWICTSRVPTIGSTIAYQTYIWIRACGVDPIHNYLGVVPVEHWHNKKKFYKYAGIEFSIDDKKETVEDCDTLQGHTAFLLDRPWNQDANVKHRVSNLTEFFAAIDSNTKAE